MTKREFLNAIATADVSDELKEFALNECIKMDERNAKRSSTPSKTAVENAPIKKAILEFITTHPKSTASAMESELGYTSAKITALCTQLKNDGLISSEKVKGVNKGKVNAYSVVEGEEA